MYRFQVRASLSLLEEIHVSVHMHVTMEEKISTF